MSIMQDAKECYVCRKKLGVENVQGLEHHHCMNAHNRSKSGEDGLMVWLCYAHHKGPKTGVHGGNKKLMNELKQDAERAWIKHNNATIEDWRARYGKNYI